MSRIHAALLRKDNYYKTLPVGKLALFLALEPGSQKQTRLLGESFILNSHYLDMDRYKAENGKSILNQALEAQDPPE